MQRPQAVAAIIRRGDRFLLGKRSLAKLTASGYWCPISGGIEPGESEEQAVVREVFEEIGVIVTPVRKITEFDTHDKKARIHWWLVSLQEGEPEIKNDENSELRWVTIEEMDDLSPIFEEDIELFKSLDPAE